MKLILSKDVKHLGLVGDVVDVKNGYARNYLLPQNLALVPTANNVKAVEKARVVAAEKRQLQEQGLREAAERLSGTEITIRAAANVEGALYGSVGPREIAAALRQEGHTVEADQVELHEPIRQLDNIEVPVRFMQDTTVDVKVWVVRETDSELADSTEAPSEGKETQPHDDVGSAAGE